MGNSVARVNGGAYKILGTLGEGGSSTVYEVRRADKRHFALKWVRGVRDADAIERLLLEIQVHKRLVHANVLPLVESEVRVSDEDKPAAGNSPDRAGPGNDGRLRLDTGQGQRAMEVLMLFPICTHGSLQTMLEDAFQKGTVLLVIGLSALIILTLLLACLYICIYEWIDGCSPFSERECLRFFAELLDAVSHVHDLGFAHRDLKPGNVLISSTDPVQPMLMDFGSIAPISMPICNAMEHSTLCEEAEQLSSAPYRPPELWTSNGYVANSVIDGRADVWQLGCILYAMAFGPYSPFENAKEGVLHLAIMNGNVRFPHKSSSSLSSQFSVTFTSLIKWMLIPDIESRPTLDEVRHQFHLIRAGGYDNAATAVTAPIMSRRTSRSRQSSHHHVPQPPPTQILSFSKLSSQEWADFAAFEKDSKVDSSPMSINSSEDWGEFTGFERSNSTSVLSTSIVWSTDSTTTTQQQQQQVLPSAVSRRQSSGRRHLIGAPIVRSRRSGRAMSVFSHKTNGGAGGDDPRQHELRRALSTRGRLLLSEALDSRV